MAGCAIRGTGLALPDRVVGNGELARRVGTADDWIRTRTGILTRRTVEGSGLATSDLAIAAARAALARAGCEAGAVDLLLVATSSADHLVPATACLVQAGLGARRAAAVDLNAACAGFLYGLALATRRSQPARRAPSSSSAPTRSRGTSTRPTATRRCSLATGPARWSWDPGKC